MKAVPVVAVALLLSACNSGSAGPSATNSPSATTTSSSPSPTASEDPKVALERVVRDYYAEANRALATGNVASLKQRTIDECACRRLVRYIEDKYRAGSLRGAVFQIKSVRAYVVEPSRSIVQVTYDAPAYEILDRSGRVIENVHADLGNKEDLYLIPRGGAWVIENVVNL